MIEIDNKKWYTEDEIQELKDENVWLKKRKEELENQLYKERRKKEEAVKQAIQDHCDHRWGYQNWVDSCFYTCTCLKCGKVETFYERD